MSLSTELREKLVEANLTLDRFRELVARLLSYGVLVREEDGTEKLLYDDARRLESVLAEYFDVAGLTLHHNKDAQFFRLYGPGAVVDGLEEDTLAPVPSLKARVSVDFVAAAIALRFLYQEKLNQGSIGTEAEAPISLEDLAATLKTHLKRQLPESATEKMALLAELKRHRLLRYQPSFSVTDEDAYLAIRPLILGIVSNEALATALDADGAIEQVTQVEEAQ